MKSFLSSLLIVILSAGATVGVYALYSIYQEDRAQTKARLEQIELDILRSKLPDLFKQVNQALPKADSMPVSGGTTTAEINLEK